VSGDSIDERIAQRKAEQDRLRATLAEWSLDGPHTVWGSGPFGPSLTYAVCLKCGAMVMLGDLEQLVEGMWTERGVRLHTAWHARVPSTSEGEGA
jgi:hypothetical protein